MAEQTLILVGNDKGGTISTLRLDGEKLSEVAVTEVGVGCSTFAIDRERDLVYCAVKDPEPAILTLSLDRATGELTEIARRPVNDTLAYIGITPHALLGASYHGGWGASWQMVDGVVGPQVTRFENRNVHAAVPDPLNRNAYFTSLGDDLIAQFSISTDGELIELSEPKVKLTPGIGPRHLILSDDDRHAYLLTEFTGEVIRFDRSEGGRRLRHPEQRLRPGSAQGPPDLGSRPGHRGRGQVAAVHRADRVDRRRRRADAEGAPERSRRPVEGRDSTAQPDGRARRRPCRRGRRVVRSRGPLPARDRRSADRTRPDPHRKGAELGALRLTSGLYPTWSAPSVGARRCDP